MIILKQLLNVASHGCIKAAAQAIVHALGPVKLALPVVTPDVP